MVHRWSHRPDSCAGLGPTGELADGAPLKLQLAAQAWREAAPGRGQRGSSYDLGRPHVALGRPGVPDPPPGECRERLPYHHAFACANGPPVRAPNPCCADCITSISGRPRLFGYLRMTGGAAHHIATIETKRVLRGSKVGPKRDQKMFHLGPNAEVLIRSCDKN
jgi:hypothetical protein